MAINIWKLEEQKFLLAIKDVKIPNATLKNVKSIVPKKVEDLDIIPQLGGCYWIWTNEPVLHSLHKNPTPPTFENGETIYNGIAKDDVKSRIKHHLFGKVNADWSGISLDLFWGGTVSHRKKAQSAKGKVPYIKVKTTLKRSSKKRGLVKGQEIESFKPIRSEEDLANIYLSAAEKKQLKKEGIGNKYFRNGIDITETKHKKFIFKVFYITGLSPLYLEFIEKKWREDNGLPKLCSYSSGR